MRNRAAAFGCLIIGGALGLVASARPWWRAVGEGVDVRLSGIQATGGLSQVLAIVALAGTLLLLALRTRGRRVMGALLVLVGGGLAVVGVLHLQPNAEAVRSQVRAVSLTDAFQMSATVWPWIFAFAGLLVVTGAAWTMITADTWPPGSERFRAGPSKSAIATSDDPAELWKAMDAGVDPTADVSAGNPRNDHDTARLPHPDVQDRAAGDTMEDTGRHDRET